MSRATSLGPQSVVLHAAVWRLELAAELAALGMEDPEGRALSVLGRICGRAGWPRAAFAMAAHPVRDGEADNQAEELMAAPEGEAGRALGNRGHPGSFGKTDRSSDERAPGLFARRLQTEIR